MLVGGGFELVKGQLSGTDGAITLSDAQLLSLTLTNLSVFVGVGGQFNATSGAAEAGPDAIGLEVSVLSLTVALVSAGSGSDNVKYTAARCWAWTVLWRASPV